MANITVTHNVIVTVSGERRNGAVVRFLNGGAEVRVLEAKTGELFTAAVSTCVPARGRPIKLIGGLCRADVRELLATSDTFCVDATRELFGRQLESERNSLATWADNKVGFRADDARRGSLLALKTACAWTAEDYSLARDIMDCYTGTQLYCLASEHLTECEILAATTVVSESARLISEICAEA